MKVLGIDGSLSKGGRTMRVLQVAIDGAKEAGADTELLDLRDYSIDFCDARDDFESYSSDTVKAGNIIKSAEALLVVTPIYNASYTGVLKNLFDVVPVSYYSGKVVGLMATSDRTNFPLAVERLRQLFTFAGSLSVPGQVTLTNEEVENIYSKHTDFKDRLLRLGRNVVNLSKVLKDAEIPFGRPRGA